MVFFFFYSGVHSYQGGAGVDGRNNDGGVCILLDYSIAWSQLIYSDLQSLGTSQTCNSWYKRYIGVSHKDKFQYFDV